MLVSDNFHEFHALGSRGRNGQSSVSFLDPNTGVLFYALASLNAIACWKPRNMFKIEQQDFIYVDNITMVFPNDLKVKISFDFKINKISPFLDCGYLRIHEKLENARNVYNMQI